MLRFLVLLVNTFLEWCQFVVTPTFLFFFIFFIVLVLVTIYKDIIGVRGILYGVLPVLLTLLVSLLSLFDEVLLWGRVVSLDLFLIEPTGLFPRVGLSFLLDPLSFCFSLLVVTIGLGTNLYTLNYFKYEAGENSFVLLLNWFIYSMLCLVFANNLFTLFLGWELIGLTSFFLINFWTRRRGTLKSSFKAFIFNKISDCFLFIFIILVWYLTSESDLTSIILTFDTTVALSHPYLYHLGAFSLIFCASIKSAQLIGHLWLPDSMEAPVPASALIHSATLVSAGLYLLLRFGSLLHLLNLYPVLIGLGAITAAYGGVVAASQTDVKKLLAYSTISHCGFLYVCVGLQNDSLVIIYLFLHGIFKALTFFCVGSFIRVSGSQDTRQMGVLSRYLPVDTVFLIFCAGNLGGLPFTFGYLYKQLFMIYLMTSPLSSISIVGLCFIGMLASLVYTFRLVYYLAFDINKGSHSTLFKGVVNRGFSIKDYWSDSTLIQSLAVFTLLSLTLCFYIFFIDFINLGSLVVDSYPVAFQATVVGGAADFDCLYQFYLNFFYILYILVIIILLVVECRKSYTFIYKVNFVLYFVIFVFFSVIFVNVL